MRITLDRACTHGTNSDKIGAGLIRFLRFKNTWPESTTSFQRVSSMSRTWFPCWRTPRTDDWSEAWSLRIPLVFGICMALWRSRRNDQTMTFWRRWQDDGTMIFVAVDKTMSSFVEGDRTRRIWPSVEVDKTMWSFVEVDRTMRIWPSVEADKTMWPFIEAASTMTI